MTMENAAARTHRHQLERCRVSAPRNCRCCRTGKRWTTLVRGFELGVNWVHTAPDYGGIDPWIAEAIDDVAPRR